MMLQRCVPLLAAIFMVATLTTAQAAPPASASTAVPASAATPQEIVQGIADQLGDAIQGHQTALRADPTRMVAIINQVVLPHFDIDYASLLVLGRHARATPPAQRVAFTKAFYDALTHRYAEGLLAYTRGAVKVLPSQGPLDQRRTIVRTRVLLDSGKNLSVDYVFRKTARGEWKAYDVSVEGISYITNYRNQVDAEIQQLGIDGLIKRLQTEGAGAVDVAPQPGAGS